MKLKKNGMTTFPRRTRATFVAIALSIAVIPGIATACSCLTYKSDEDSFRKAKVVVVGRVLATRYVADEKEFGGGYVEATAAVSMKLKGATGLTVTVKDQIPEGGMCSAFLRTGVEFVLFVAEDGSVSMCNGTRAFGASIYDRSEKLNELDELKSRAEGGK